MERIWAPWRMEFVAQPKGNDDTHCVFCDLLTDVKNNKLARERLILWQDDHVAVLMNRYPYTNGHLLVIPKVHQARLDQLSPEVFANLHSCLRECIGILERTLNTEGINMGANFGRAAGAGIDQHMHYHLVPRWSGDNNFMPVLAENRIISQHLMATFDQLLPAFQSL